MLRHESWGAGGRSHEHDRPWLRRAHREGAAARVRRGTQPAHCAGDGRIRRLGTLGGAIRSDAVERVAVEGAYLQPSTFSILMTGVDGKTIRAHAMTSEQTTQAHHLRGANPDTHPAPPPPVAR